MKRKLLCWLMTVCFMIGLCPTNALSTDSVIFTAVDINMLELTDETMPFWYGGYLYVDSRIFSGLESTYGTINHSRNISKQTTALYTTQSPHALIFYLDTGTTMDSDSRTYHAQAIVKGDVVFVPAIIVSTYFDMRYTTVAVNHGTLVRLTVDQNPILDDTTFVNAAANWIEVRYNEYLKTQTTTSTTTTDTISPPPPVANSQTILLAFAVTTQTNVSTLVSQLNQVSGQATFFFTPEAMEEQTDLLRQLQVQGHQIGLLADGSLETPVLDQLAWGNELLYQATTTITRLVYLEQVEDATDVIQAGYCPVTAQVDVSESGLLTANGASITMARIDAVSGSAIVWLGDKTTTSGLSTLLYYAEQSKDQFRALNLLLAT